MINKVGSQGISFAKNVSQKNDTKDINSKKAESKSDLKLSEISEAIKNGTYKLDLNKTAKAVADQLI